MAAVAAPLVFGAGHAAAKPRHKAKPLSEADKIKQLQKGLDERDALIRNLMRRVDRLEREQRVLASRAGKAGAPGSRTVAPKPVSFGGTSQSPPARQTAQAPASESPAPASPPAAAAPAPSPAPAGQPAATGPAAAAGQAAAPGQFSVSPEAAQRALERALVQTGAQLLEPGKFELVPSVTYQNNEFTRPFSIALATATPTSPTGVFISQDVFRQEVVQAGLLLRAGLPFDAQVEVGLPYAFKSNSTTVQIVGANLSQHIADAVGLADPTLTLTKQVAKEGSWRPNIFLSGTWDSNLGETAKGIPLGTGFNEFRAAVLASKRQDPLVFTAGLTYQATLENHHIQPGDELIPSLGMLFAVSPETSLQFSQQVAFIQKTRFNGNLVPGSSQFQGIFTAGVLSILAPGIVANFTAAIGETPDAPNLTLQLAFPIRLN